MFLLGTRKEKELVREEGKSEEKGGVFIFFFWGGLFFVFCFFA